MKEVTISIIAIVIVVIASVITQKYLEKTSTEILDKLSELKTEVKNAQENDNTNNATKISTEILEKWEETNTIWSTLIIHEELDNIELSLIELKSHIENSEFEEGLAEIEKSMFLVGHIQEKEKFKIKNIF